MSTIDNPDRVKEFFRRYEDIETRKAEINEEMKDLKAEFKGENFDVPLLVEAYKISKADQGERDEKDFVIKAYLDAAGK